MNLDGRAPPGALLYPLILAAVLLAGASAARAQSLSARGDRLAVGLGSRPSLDSTDTRARALLYQYVNLTTEDLLVDGFNVELVGVVGATLDEGADGEGINGSMNGDVIVGLVSWRNRDRSLTVHLGRQYLFPGGGRAEHLDGAAVTYRVWHVDLTAFGGRTHAWQWSFEEGDTEPADPTFSSWAVGGRARLRLLDLGLVSVGFLHEGDGGEAARQVVSFDAGFWRFSWFEALAGGIVDVVAGQPQELWTELIFRPLDPLKLSAGYTYLVPGLAIPKTSLFSVFSEDEHHDLSLQAFYGFGARFMAGVEGGVRLFPQRDSEAVGFRAALHGRVALDSQRQHRVGLKVEFDDQGDRRFIQGRLHSVLAFFERRLYCRADLFLLGLLTDRSGDEASAYERAITSTPLSVGGLGTVGWRFAPRWSANIGASVFSTARARSDLRIMSRLTFDGFWSWN